MRVNSAISRERCRLIVQSKAAVLEPSHSEVSVNKQIFSCDNNYENDRKFLIA